MNATLLNRFDRSKPFYPLVLLYVTQLIGARDLALRGVLGREDFDALLGRIPGLAELRAEGNPNAAELVEALRLVTGPLQLRSEYQGNHIEIDTDVIARDVFANFGYVMQYEMRAAAAVLILAHELSKDEPSHNTSPLWEFLRHCRNAAAHGGRFNLLRYGEPKRPARWGAFEITPEMEGVRLFRTQTDAGLLSPGDPIRLLWDIEQAFPAMKA